MFSRTDRSSAGPFRSSRLRAPSLLPGTRRPSFLNNLRDQQTTVVVDPTHNPTTAPQAAAANKDEPVKRRETLFGPDVGDDEEPGWDGEAGGDGSRTKGEISVDTVKAWVDRARSEEVSWLLLCCTRHLILTAPLLTVKGVHATTTLQALVNLKRPTLTLSLLPSNLSDLPSIDDDQVSSTVSLTPIGVAHTPLHLLKFKYDATAPNVAITLTLHSTPTDDGRAVGTPQEIYYGVHPGGFNQAFNLDPSHAIDLSPACAPLPTEEEEDDNKVPPKLSSTDSEINGDSLRNTQALETPPVAAPAPAAAPSSRRFGGLLGRRRHDEPTPAQLEAGAGIEMQNVQPDGEAVQEKPKPERGMRVLIRIEALGVSGRSFSSSLPVLTARRTPREPERAIDAHLDHRHVDWRNRCAFICSC